MRRADFHDFLRTTPNASISFSGAMLPAQINRTALSFATVRRVVHLFDGSPARFHRWMQMDVPPG